MPRRIPAAILRSLALLVGLTATNVHAGRMVVSLTFDDTFDSQLLILEALQRNGMKATFYINSSRVDESKYMTREQLLDLQAKGHELAGHTVNHARLTLLDPLEQRRQICNDRKALIGMGFRITSLAYPFGATDAVTELAATECGYNSARRVGNLWTAERTCTNCPIAETLPPKNPMDIRTPSSVGMNNTLDDLKTYVTQLEQAGEGWLPLVFHQMCDGCNPYGFPVTAFSEFVDWLATRKAAGVEVLTVHEVSGIL